MWGDWQVIGTQVEVDPASLKRAIERDEAELKAQSCVVTHATRGWKVTTREAAQFWERVNGHKNA